MSQSLYAQYCKKIQSWDWAYIVSSAKEQAEEDYEGNVIGIKFLGTVFSLMPSGKFYVPWSSNITRKEAHRDEQYMSALEYIASDHGGWIESGASDPCDIFFCISIGKIDKRIADDR